MTSTSADVDGWRVVARSVEALFGNPRHPYTQGLIRSIPRVDRAAEKKQRLEAIATYER